MAEEEANSKKLQLNIKTIGRKESVEITGDATVRQLKELLFEKRKDAPVERQRLLLAGKVLKNEETIKGQGIKSGATIHLVIRSSGRSSHPSDSQADATPTATIASSSTSVATRPSLTQTSSSGPQASPMVNPFGAGLAGSGDTLSQMMQQFMSNPELFQRFMQSPMAQNVMSNPEAYESMLTSNPQIQQALETQVELVRPPVRGQEQPETTQS